VQVITGVLSPAGRRRDRVHAACAVQSGRHGLADWYYRITRCRFRRNAWAGEAEPPFAPFERARSDHGDDSHEPREQREREAAAMMFKKWTFAVARVIKVDACGCPPD
jgi:hypothetical protein